MCGLHWNACANGQLAGFKRYHQEGGIRIPYILSWPDGFQGNRTIDAPVISLDLMATLTAAAGNSLVTEDSVNLLPYLTGETEKNPHDYLYWRSGPTIAIRDERWKLIKFKQSNFNDDAVDSTGRLTAPVDGWATDAPLGYLTVLYDLKTDPGETTNLAYENPNIVDQLEKAHSNWNSMLPPADEAILTGIRSIQTEIEGKTVQLIF